MKRKKERPLGILILPLILVVVLMFSAAISNLEVGRDREGKQQLEDALRSAVMACYAAEGIFPPTLEYLEEHYKVLIDHDRYTVIYESIGANLMPDITVLENGL